MAFTDRLYDLHMSEEHPIKVALEWHRRGHKKRPVIHVTMPDGRVTEFKDMGIVLPAAGQDDGGVYALLVNAQGEPFATPDGEPAVVEVPVFLMDMKPDPEEVIKGWRKIAKHIGVSPKTAERMEQDGRLPKAYRPSERQVIYKRKQLDDYLASK